MAKITAVPESNDVVTSMWGGRMRARGIEPSLPKLLNPEYRLNQEEIRHLFGGAESKIIVDLMKQCAEDKPPSKATVQRVLRGKSKTGRLNTKTAASFTVLASFLPEDSDLGNFASMGDLDETPGVADPLAHLDQKSRLEPNSPQKMHPGIEVLVIGKVGYHPNAIAPLGLYDLVRVATFPLYGDPDWERVEDCPYRAIKNEKQSAIRPWSYWIYNPHEPIDVKSLISPRLVVVEWALENVTEFDPNLKFILGIAENNPEPMVIGYAEYSGSDPSVLKIYHHDPKYADGNQKEEYSTFGVNIIDRVLPIIAMTP